MRGRRLATTISKLQIIWAFLFSALFASHILFPIGAHAQYMFGPGAGFVVPTFAPDPGTTKVHDAFTYIWENASTESTPVVYTTYIEVEDGSEVIFEGGRMMGYRLIVGQHLTIEVAALDRETETGVISMGYEPPDCSHAMIMPVRLSDLLPDLLSPAGRYRITYAYDTTCQDISYHVSDGYMRINHGQVISEPPPIPTPTITPTFTPTVTPSPTETPTPTLTPSELPSPSPENGAGGGVSEDGGTPSETPSPAPTISILPTWTPTPSASQIGGQATPTATRAPTSTPIYISPIPFTTASAAAVVTSTPTPTLTLVQGEVLGATTQSVRTCVRTVPVMQSVSTPETYTDYEWGIVRYETQTSSWTEYVPQLVSRWVTRPITQAYACTQYREEQYQITKSAIVTKEVCSGNWWEVLTCSVARWVSEVITWVEWATRMVAYTATCYTTTVQNTLEEYWATTPITHTSTSQVPIYGWKTLAKTRMKTSQVPTGQTQCVEWVTKEISVTLAPTKMPTQTPTSTPTPIPEYQSWTRTYIDPVTGATSQNTYQAHMIDVPYFTQCPVGTFYNGIQPDPPNCYQTCGASSAVMLAASMGKITYTSPADLRSHVFSDASIPDSLKSCPNLEGAFAVTAVAPSCNYNGPENIRKYLEWEGVPMDMYSTTYSFDAIKQSLLLKKPVILSFLTPGHIVLAKGYTSDKCLIFNDTWEDLTKDPGQRYTTNGNSAVYCLDKNGNIPDDNIWFNYQLVPK